MSRIIDSPISNPTLDGQHRPLRFRWAGQVIVVARVLDDWPVIGRWWEQEPETHWRRVQAAGGGVYELYQDLPKGPWHLYKIYD